MRIKYSKELIPSRLTNCIDINKHPKVTIKANPFIKIEKSSTINRLLNIKIFLNGLFINNVKVENNTNDAKTVVSFIKKEYLYDRKLVITTPTINKSNVIVIIYISGKKTLK
jgi:hypothetical protein